MPSAALSRHCNSDNCPDKEQQEQIWSFSYNGKWLLPFGVSSSILLIDMMRLLRPFVVLLTVLAFSVSSLGWGTASALMVSSGGHHAPIEASQSIEAHEHGRGELVQNSAYQQVDSSTFTQHGDTSNSCCAMACHTVIPAAAYTMAVFALEQTIDYQSREASAEESSAARLDRPPRSAAA